jgi:hypothetical protein
MLLTCLSRFRKVWPSVFSQWVELAPLIPLGWFLSGKGQTCPETMFELLWESLIALCQRLAFPGSLTD